MIDKEKPITRRGFLFHSGRRTIGSLISWTGRPVLLLFTALCLSGSFAGAGEEKGESRGAKQVVRTAFGAGRWFPADGRELGEIVDGFIEKARVPAFRRRIVGAVAPHAGYIYSGRVAGYTFRALRDNAAGHGVPEVAVVLGFSHRARFEGVALMDGDAIQTPLGPAPLHGEAARILADQGPRIYFDHRPHRGEHSAENQIPFLQRALPGARLVIALMGNHDPHTLDDLVKALDTLSKRMKIVVIASSDMLHDPDYNLVTRTDRETLKMMESMDYTGLGKGWTYSGQILCGIGPVLAVVRFSRIKGCRRGVVLTYRNSGDDFPEGRGRWVVGYGSVVFARDR